LAAKLNISKNQTSEDIFIYFSDDKYLIHHLPEKPQKRPFGIRKKDNMLFRTDLESIYTQKGKEYVSRKNIRLLGEHNLLNIMAALNVAEHFNISKNTVLKVLKNFAGIEHRLEFVATIKGVDYYNDSKATNVESVKYALKSFTRPVIIIMGGRDKDSDFSTLLPYLSENVKEAVLIGEAAQKIENVIRGKIKYFHADSLSNAVDYAKTIAVAGDVILLAPACASFDMFDNYEHRGRVFKEIVQSIADKTDEN
ncbi:MAG: UDP-N-acetylmuramoyl-L-alanine--D-glutamate ligase, partial [Candidatus Neomarinimicrobiota bacterium]